MPLFDLASIDAATNRFSQENLIGIGGFGPVYKVRITTSCQTKVRKVSASFCILKTKSCKLNILSKQLAGHPSNRKRNCCKETIEEFRTRC